MLLYLFAKVVDGNVDVLHTIRNQTIYIMVNDALSAYFKQWFWSLLGQRTKSLTLASCHQYGINRKASDILVEIDYFNDMIILIKDRHEFHLLHFLLMKMLHIVINTLAKEIEVTMNNFFYGIIY